MAFLSRIGRALTAHSSPAAAASSIFQSRSVLARFYSTTLTSPKLFVSGLSRLTSDEKLHEAFAKFGNVVEAKVVTDRATQKSKGFGFVTYATIEDAEKAKEGLNGTFLDGWVIFVDPAKPREQRPPPQMDQQQQSHTGFRVNKTVGWCG